jgi:hypothetical protein
LGVDKRGGGEETWRELNHRERLDNMRILRDERK